MRLGTRKVIDRSFTALGAFSILLVALGLLALLEPIVVRGAGAFVFRGTVEHRRVLYDEFQRGDVNAINAELERAEAARRFVYEHVAQFEHQLKTYDELSTRLEDLEKSLDETLWNLEDDQAWLDELAADRKPGKLGPDRELEDLEKLLQALDRDSQTLADAQRELDRVRGTLRREPPLFAVERRGEYQDHLLELKDNLRQLLGPLPDVKLSSGVVVPGDGTPAMPRDRYGETRWGRARTTLHHVLMDEVWVDAGPGRPLEQRQVSRASYFRGTPVEPVFDYLARNSREMLLPRWAFYWRFLSDHSWDSHIFGGIGAEVLGTLYLTIGAILFAVPLGVISAIYLVEYAGDNWLVSILRSCISTLAGVPSIVFGLFGLAFFINELHVSPSKSVLAGSLTLALLIMPVVIRAAEEAIRAVPHTYKEAGLSMGATKWRTIVTVVLPAALPGILTGIVISMGRAAGETAPIIFTAAVSLGPALAIHQTLTQATPTLPWGVYALSTEHQNQDEIKHVQYGMVLTLVLLVLLLNSFALVVRARISRKLRG